MTQWLHFHHEDKKVDQRKDVRAYLEELSRITQIELEKNDFYEFKKILEKAATPKWSTSAAGEKLLKAYQDARDLLLEDNEEVDKNEKDKITKEKG